MKMKKLGILLGCLCWAVFAQAQMIIQGNVTEENGTDIPFANICLFASNDTTRVVQSAMSDLKGDFQLAKLKAGNYRIQVSFLGFKTFYKQLELSSQSGTTSLQVQLAPDAQQLDAVAVTGKSMRVAADKVVYTIGSGEVKGKTQALELISRIPKLSVDPVEQKIKSHDGKEVKVLVNGMSASENILKTIRPEQVIRMEHYDIPPARFAQ